MRKNFGPSTYLFPMPVLIIAAYDENQKPCCMNAAWGGICGVNLVGMCISPGHKTVKNIMKTGDFTVSIGDEANEIACDYVGIVSGNEMPDKFTKAGFHATKSEFVNAPVIDELSVTLECKMVSYDDELHFMVGEIVNTSADERVLSADGKIDPAKIRPIMFDPVNHNYNVIGEIVGKAYFDGNKLK